MGTWGPGPFDNDPAMDLILEFEERGLEAFVDYLPEEAIEEDYFEIDVGASLIVLGEIIAACHGQPLTQEPEEFPMGRDLAALSKKLVAHRDAVPESPHLLNLVQTHWDKVMDPERSEIMDCWDDAGGEGLAAFKAHAEDLRARLSKVAA